MARPTEYDPRFVDEIIEYFSVAPYSQETDPVLDKNGQAIFDPQGRPLRVESGRRVASDFPSFAGFAAKIGVNRKTIDNWRETWPEFDEAYMLAKEYQENFLLVNGLRELTHPQFTMFVAKNVLGYREKQPDEHDVVINNSVGTQTDEELQRRFDEIMAKAHATNGEKPE